MRRFRNLAVGAVLSALCGLAAPGSAGATTTNYCGGMVPSGSYCNGPLFGWSYVSTSAYLNLTGLTARMNYTSVAYQNVASNVTFVSVCHYTPYSATPSSRHLDGVSRTLFGYADDSPNHTGCI